VSGLSSPVRSLHDRYLPAVETGLVSEVPVSSPLSPVICQDRTFVQMSVPGHELQIMPGCALGRLWEPPVRVPPIPGTSAFPPFIQANSSFFSGGSVRSGMDFCFGW
jgi:hypothetical protein